MTMSIGPVSISTAIFRCLFHRVLAVVTFAMASAGTNVSSEPTRPVASTATRAQAIGSPGRQTGEPANVVNGASGPSDMRTLLSEMIAARVKEGAEASANGGVAPDDEHLAAALGSDLIGNPKESGLTASSSLDPEHALRLAKLVCAVMPRSSYCYILPTGSMKPLFGEKVILLLETAPFESLRVGDIVTFRHPRFSTLIVHRLVAGDCTRFRSKGDANRLEDDVYVTRANYRQRVFGIIYSK
jgi:hypothetical protein